MLGHDLDGHGIRLVDGEGQPNVLDIADAFAGADIVYGAFLDNEDTYSGRRARLRDERCIDFIWSGAKNIEDAICRSLALDALFQMITDAAEATEIEARYLEDQVYQAIPENERREGARALRTAGYEETILRSAFYTAMTARKAAWFKSREGGRILARALTRIGMPTAIKAQVESFGTRLKSNVS